MRLVQDHSDSAYVVNVRCVSCGKRVKLADTSADVDSESFEAYYCHTCVDPSKAAPCRRPGCSCRR